MIVFRKKQYTRAEKEGLDWIARRQLKKQKRKLLKDVMAARHANEKILTGDALVQANSAGAQQITDRVRGIADKLRNQSAKRAKVMKWGGIGTLAAAGAYGGYKLYKKTKEDNEMREYSEKETEKQKKKRIKKRNLTGASVGIGLLGGTSVLSAEIPKFTKFGWALDKKSSDKIKKLLQNQSDQVKKVLDLDTAISLSGKAPKGYDRFFEETIRPKLDHNINSTNKAVDKIKKLGNKRAKKSALKNAAIGTAIGAGIGLGAEYGIDRLRKMRNEKRNEYLKKKKSEKANINKN